MLSLSASIQMANAYFHIYSFGRIISIVYDAIELYYYILHSLLAQVVMVNLVNAARKETCEEGMRLCVSCVSKLLTLLV